MSAIHCYPQYQPQQPISRKRHRKIMRMRVKLARIENARWLQERMDHDLDDDTDHLTCDRCAGEGGLEYSQAGPDVWGEDCPSEMNHLVTCPDCGGSGYLQEVK